MKHPRLFAPLFLLLGLFLGACGGPPATPEPDPTDRVAPTLTSSLPATGAVDVPINVRLGLAFNERMDKTSLELTSNPPIALGTAVWNSENTSVAFANDRLKVATAYALTVRAKDVSGNPLAATTLSFTTSDVADTTPPGIPTGLVATPADGQVTLTWKTSPEDNVVGYTLYLGTAQDRLEPKDLLTSSSTTLGGLANGTTYFFAIDAVDAANNHSGRTEPVSATPSVTVTDSTPPTLQSSNPEDQATGVNPRNPSINLVFSEPMDTASFSLAFAPPDPFPSLMDFGPLATTPFQVVWSDTDTVATLTLEPPSELLRENTVFNLTLSVNDKAGNALSGKHELTFTTGEEAPVLVLSTPANGATDIGVEPFEIKLVFSKPMDTETVKVTPILEPLDIPFYSQSWTPTWSENDTLVTLTTAIDPGYFLEDTTYRLLLAGKSKSGVELADTTVTFRTVADPTRPTIVSTSPLDATIDRPLSPLDVFIYFDDLMDVSSTLSALSSSPSLPCTWQQFFDFSANDTSLKSAFACRSDSETFAPDTTYTVTVSTTARDTSGNALDIGTCLADPADPPCAYTFTFKTLTPPPPTGTLRLEVNGLPLGQKRVRVTGPDFDSGLLDEGTTFSNLLTGDYTIAASAFTVAPGKPACRIYTPAEDLQVLIPVNANKTTTATVTYESISCAL